MPNNIVKKTPERKCMGCNEKKPKKELVRVVRTPEGEVLLDLTGKKSGRGAYICKSTACLNKAKKAIRLESSLECSIPEEVFTRLAEELAVGSSRKYAPYRNARICYESGQGRYRNRSCL